MQRCQLRLHQLAGVGRQVRSDAHDGSMRAMRGRESIVDEQITKRCEVASETGVVGLVLFVVPDVLQQQDLPWLQSRNRPSRGLADAVFREQDVASDVARKVRRDRLQRQVRFPVLRPTEVRHDDDLRPTRCEVLQRRRGGAHTRVVGDATAGHRDVEVFADQHALARDVDRGDRSFQRRSAMYEIRSTMRQLKPHSLSYQLTILAQSPPRTAVEGASTIDECGSFLKSDDTSSSWLTARIPRRTPLAASSNAALMSSAVVDLPSWAVRSTTETSRMGTRNEMPANFPASSGITSATARFAPVDVGMMLSAAARARRRSLCGRSCSF